LNVKLATEPYSLYNRGVKKAAPGAGTPGAAEMLLGPPKPYEQFYYIKRATKSKHRYGNFYSLK